MRSRMRYNLYDKVPPAEMAVYAMQHMIFFLASAIVMPVVAGYGLGLDPAEVGQLLQRTLFFCGVVSLMQVLAGHLYPIMDGPAGMWFGLIMLMASAATTFGRDLSVLRTDLEGGFLIAGAIIVVLVLTGLMKLMMDAFTPIINGVIIMLMTLQLSPGIVKGMTGISAKNSQVDVKSVIVFTFTVFAVLLISYKGKGFIQSIATFIGVVAGWIFSAFLGLTQGAKVQVDGIIAFPRPLAWGMPTINIGIVLTCVIGALVLLSMVFASVNGMADAIGEEVDKKRMNKSIGVHGLATMLSGVFPTIPPMPYVSAVGIVKLTGVAARGPFILCSAIVMVMGLISPLGAFLSTIPGPVGYGALVVIFSLILGQGLKEFQKVTFTNRESYIVGISLLIGVGVMFLPVGAFEEMPAAVGHILSNGLIDGMVVALLLEHLVLRKKSA